MKIAFLVHRKSYYKYFSPLIEEALRRGHSVFCIHDLFWVIGTSKAYDSPVLNSVPRFAQGSPTVLSWENPDELGDIIERFKIDTLVFLNTHPIYPKLQEAFRRKHLAVSWVAMQHASDVLLCTQDLLRYDRVLVYSDRWTEWAKEALQEEGGSPDQLTALTSKCVPVGHSELDVYAAIEPQSVRQAWGIPLDKKIVLLLPFPFDSSVDRYWVPYIYGAPSRVTALAAGALAGRPRWMGQAWRGENDRNVVKAIRRFCDANNALLFIKARLKDPVRPYARRLADKVLYDEEFYPSTIAQCLAIADLCIHFSSNIVYEAAFRSIPSLAILPNRCDYKDFRTYRPYLKFREMINFTGVNQSFSVVEAINRLPQLRFDDLQIDAIRRSDFLKTYLGFQDSHSASRSLDSMEALVPKTGSPSTSGSGQPISC